MSEDIPYDGFTGIYVHDNQRQRDDFDHWLAEYLRSQHERWDVTPIVEALDRLGHDIEEVRVQLQRRSDARLRVTIEFDVEPIGVPSAPRC